MYSAAEVDPTGAGDSFDGAFLAMLCCGAELETAVRYASAAGARAVEKRGPMEGNSTRSELEEFMLSREAPPVKIIANPYKCL